MCLLGSLQNRHTSYPPRQNDCRNCTGQSFFQGSVHIHIHTRLLQRHRTLPGNSSEHATWRHSPKAQAKTRQFVSLLDLFYSGYFAAMLNIPKIYHKTHAYCIFLTSDNDKNKKERSPISGNHSFANIGTATRLRLPPMTRFTGEPSHTHMRRHVRHYFMLSF